MQRKKVELIDLGLIAYENAYRFQKEVLRKRQLNRTVDTLIFLEHNNVFTIGRAGSKDNILANENTLREKGISVYEVDRGGNITYHGPGQLVIYPIFDLRRYGKDIHLYLRNLEEVVIKFLEEHRLNAVRIKGFTGVWVGNCKIASIGIGISRWVTYHGVSINVNPDMSYFSLIAPCGLMDRGTICLSEIKDFPIDMNDIKQKVAKGFEDVFGLKVVYGKPR